MTTALKTSEEQADYVQAFYKAFLEFADLKNDLPREKRSSTDVSPCDDRQNQASSAERHAFGPLDVVFLGNPYPPCRSSMRDLESTMLTQLVMNRHHRGKYLLAKLTSIISVCPTITTVGIEDIKGDFEVLAINPACTNTTAEPRLPEVGRWLVVKEPFLTLLEYDKRPCIRVDHPSDLMDADSLAPDLRDSEPFLEVLRDNHKRTPLQYKEAGNTAHRNKNFSVSNAHYTQGLLLLTDDADGSNHAMKQDLYRNRSHAKLMLGLYEGAVEDATAAITHVQDEKHIELDVKAYFRAANASYKLKRFDRADHYLRALLELMPADKDALVLLKRTKKRLQEQERGKYDFGHLDQQIASQMSIDTADYLVNTAIAPSSPGHGRGLFSTRDLKAGELIMAEGAFCYLTGQDDTFAIECNAARLDHKRMSRVGLWAAVTRKMMSNPVLAREFLNLHRVQESYETQLEEVDGCAVADTFQVHDMLARNAFGSPREQEDHFSGVWIRSAYINHSCIPNAERGLVGDMMLVHATRPIKQGEEISLSYTGFDEDYCRAYALESSWGFKCDCPLCLADADCSDDIRNKRGQLTLQFCQSQQSTPPEMICKTDQLEFIEKQARDIAATYDSKLYWDLPKTGLIQIQAYLLRAYMANDDMPKIHQACVELLQTLCFTVLEEGGDIWAICTRPNSILPRDAIALRKPLLFYAIKAQDRGVARVTQHLFDFARSLEVVCHGTDDQTVEEFNEAMSPAAVLKRMTKAMFGRHPERT